MIPITRVCGRLFSYVAVSRRLSPAETGMPFAVENVVMCFGPFSCMTGLTTGNPQVGSEREELAAAAGPVVSASFSPPPWRCAPPRDEHAALRHREVRVPASTSRRAARRPAR